MKFTRHRCSTKPYRNRQNGDSVRHKELEDKIEMAIRRFNACPLNGTDYVTYVIKERIRCVGKPDVEVPFYVGQTGDLGRRTREHFECAGRPGHRPASVYWRMHQILKDYRVPVIDILERTPTLATSLLSESMWVRKFIADGLHVHNQWTEHRPGKFTGNVPAKRLWTCNLREALMDQLRLAVACRKCGLRLELPLEEIAEVAPLSTSLSALRINFRCPRCDTVPCLRLEAYRATSNDDATTLLPVADG